MKSAILRYHGGKHKIAGWIIDNMPQHSCYVEPFGGGASVLIAKSPAKTDVYNDLDKEVFNVFRTIRENGKELAERLHYTLYSREELRLAYEPTECPIESARRFIVRSHMAISTTSSHVNSGFRAAINSDDYASQAITFYRIPELIETIRARFARVILENCDAFSLFDRYDKPKTLWFLDPPYLNDTRSDKSIKHGYAHNLSDTDHIRLCERIQQLKGYVMLSGYHNPIYNEYLKGWNVISRKGFSDSRKKTGTEEVLWTNFLIQTKLFNYG